MLVFPRHWINRIELKTENNPLDSQSDPDLEVLRDMFLFVAVAESGSFTAAAKKVRLPNSTLSWRINEFELALGVKLFNRTTRRVELTSAGSMHLGRCKQLVCEAQAITSEMRAQSNVPRGRLRISTTADFAIVLLAPLLPEFERRYPQISLDIDTNATRADLVAENLDLAIRMGTLPDSGMVARFLMDAHLNLYASPEYLQRFGTPQSPGELMQHHCLKAGAEPGEVLWRLRRGSEVFEARALPKYWTNNLGLVRQMMLNGQGIGVLVEELYAQDISSGRVVRVLPEWTYSTVTVSAVLPQRHIPAKTRVFVDFLVEMFTP
jgi:DNA-binding transcriptional LysR family regulator